MINRRLLLIGGAALVAGLMLGRLPSCGGGASSSSLQSDELILSNFESVADMGLWQMKSAAIERVSEHASGGIYAAMITFVGNGQLSSVQIADALEHRAIPNDWRRYERMTWTMHNPTKDRQRLILQIKDANDRRFKKDIWLEPEASTEVNVFLDVVRSAVNLGRIVQLELFRWKPAGDLTVYMDELRLIRAGADGEPEEAASQDGMSVETQAPTEQVLGSFETGEDLARWLPVSAELVRVPEHATHGTSAARLELRAGGAMSGMKLVDFRGGLSDWSPYSRLLFDAFNTSDRPQRLIVEIKDEHGKRYKQDVLLAAQSAGRAEVSLVKARREADITRVEHLTLYQWSPTASTTLLIDHVRLSPQRAEEAPAAGGANPFQFSRIQPVDVPGFEEHRDRWMGAAADWTAGSSAGAVPAAGGLSAGQVVRVPLLIDEQSGVSWKGWPSTGGIPLPRGTFRPGDPVRLLTADGAEAPVQTRPLVLWDDGSVKWLLVDAQPELQAGKRFPYTLEYGGALQASDVTSFESPLTVEQTPDALTVTTGPLRFAVNRRAGTFFDAVWVDQNADAQFDDNERVAGRPASQGSTAPEGGDLIVRHRGQEYRASLDTESYEAVVEEAGPLRAVIRCSGWFRDHTGKGFGKYIVRLHAFRGVSFVRVEHTFIYTGYPENTYHFVYEGKPLPENETVESIELALPVAVEPSQAQCAFGDTNGVYRGDWNGDIELWQFNHNQFGVLRNEEPAMSGAQLLGWLDVSDMRRGVTVSVRDFWQQYPKGMNADAESGRITVSLWPARSGALDLKTTAAAYGPDAVARGSAFGLGKTHEMYWYFHGGVQDRVNVETFVRRTQEPALVRADSDWAADSKALGWLESSSQTIRTVDAVMHDLFDWAARQQKEFAWYGMLNYGDTLSWHRDQEEDGDTTYPTADWHPVGRWGWYNCEVTGLHTGTLLQFVRTGRWAYFQFGEATARHIMDVDTCHYNTVANDPRLNGVISDEFSQPGSMHRHNADHWGGRNEETSHTNIAGLSLYYCLTGSWRAWDVLQEVGQFLSREPITYTNHPDIAPQRNLANLVWGEAILYELTREPSHLDRAAKWAKVLIEGQQENGAWTETYDPTGREWVGEPKTLFMSQYTIPALMAYYRQAHDPAVGEAIVRATDYVASHDKFLPMFHALAYAYELTGDLTYHRTIGEHFDMIQREQQHGADPLLRGMIYKKIVYHRPNMFLFSMPFGAGLLSANESRLREWASRSRMPAASGAASDVVQAAVFSSLVKVFKDPLTLGENASIWTNPEVRLSAAQGESESAQIVLYSPEAALQDVSVSVTPLRNERHRSVIEASHIRVRRVGYVFTNAPEYPVSHVGWWPDPLRDEPSFTVQPSELTPVWVTVSVPTGTPPGVYRGEARIALHGETARVIPVEVRVRNFGLMPVGHLRTAFDFYPTRLRSAYEEFLPEAFAQWQWNMDDLQDRYLRSMLSYRLSPVLNVTPTNADEAGRLTQYVEQGLNAFAVGANGGSFDNNWPEEESGLRDMIPVYRELAEWLRGRGLLDRAYVYAYDEPSFGHPHVAQVASVLHEAAPDLRTMVCMNDLPDPREWSEQSEAWFKDIDIVCLRNVTATPGHVDALRALGKEVWLYVSGPAPPFPTFALDYPAVACRVMPWMCWKYGATGLLYWCVNFWRTDPWLEPMNTEWGQNANGVLLYPGPEGPVPSLRLEVLRDGLEDYEYLWLLRGLVGELESLGGESDTASLLEEARALLEVDESLVRSFGDYEQDPQAWLSRRERIGDMIERLVGVWETLAQPGTAAVQQAVE